jgi:hypothetical protein
MSPQDLEGGVPVSKKNLSNHEIVTLAVYLLGGESRQVDTEDVAIKANELAPGRYVWKKYREQVNLEIIRVYLSDAKKPAKGGYLIGNGNEGWLLTERGLQFSRSHGPSLGDAQLAREPITTQERKWRQTERSRIRASDALAKYQAGGIDAVSQEDIEGLFRLNAYIRGRARERKVLKIVNTFGDDPEVGEAVRAFGKRLREGNDG